MTVVGAALSSAAVAVALLAVYRTFRREERNPWVFASAAVLFAALNFAAATLVP